MYNFLDEVQASIPDPIHIGSFSVYFAMESGPKYYLSLYLHKGNEPYILERDFNEFLNILNNLIESKNVDKVLRVEDGNYESMLLQIVNKDDKDEIKFIVTDPSTKESIGSSVITIDDLQTVKPEIVEFIEIVNAYNQAKDLPDERARIKLFKSILDKKEDKSMKVEEVEPLEVPEKVEPEKDAIEKVEEPSTKSESINMVLTDVESRIINSLLYLTSVGDRFPSDHVAALRMKFTKFGVFPTDLSSRGIRLLCEPKPEDSVVVMYKGTKCNAIVLAVAEKTMKCVISNPLRVIIVAKTDIVSYA